MRDSARLTAPTLRGVLVVVATALATRLVTLTILDPVPGVFSGDTPIFMNQRGFGYEPPGYPFFLGLTYPWLGAVGVILLQMIATIGAAVTTYLRIPGKIGLWTALLIAACPFFVVYEVRLLTEALVCALLWIALVILIWPKHKWEPVLAGLLMAGAILGRDTLYFMPLLLPLAALRTARLKAACVAAAVAFLTVLPWQVANRSFALSQGRAGLTLWIGTWETDSTWYRRGLDHPDWPADAFQSPEQKGRILQAIRSNDDRTLAAIAIDRMKSAPVDTAKTWAVRYPRLWLGTRTDAVPLRLDRQSLGWMVAKLGFLILNLLILTAGLVGLWRSRHNPVARLIAVPIVYIGAILIPFHNTETRYSALALMPLLFFGAHALTAFRTAKLKTSASDSAPPDRFSTTILNEPAATPSTQ